MKQITNLNCNWYIGSTLIADSVSGLFVSPGVTATYTVEQNLCGIITYDSVTVYVSGVGVSEKDWSSEINLYPNPNNGTLTISIVQKEVKDLKIEIFDIFGSLVYLKTSNTINTEVNIENVPKGLYVAKLSNDLYNETLKFVKE